jgi:3D (Asp-Asp-Asp) domain-containing protein
MPADILRRRRLRRVVEAAGYLALVVLVALSAIVTKEAQVRARLQALTEVTELPTDPTPELAKAAPVIHDPLRFEESIVVFDEPPAPVVEEPTPPRWGAEVRWFNARPVRPKKTIWMTVTAYSPDERSCGDSADNITSSIHNVWTNAMKLVAADSRILPLGSMISVPGYDQGRVVPVLDRGGAIKGHRLDVLFPNHELARKWGVRHVPVVVWDYADGLPRDDFRKIRDSRD